MKEKDRRIVRELKKEATLFTLFDEEDLRVIVPYFGSMKIPAGKLVYEEGAPPDFLAIIRNGRVDVKKETAFKGKQIVLAQMTEGAVLGEMAVFDDQPRSASVEAVEDTELLILTREKLDAFIAEHPELGVKILKGISRVLSLRLRQLADRLVMIF